jgi:hypothetical protein
VKTWPIKAGVPTRTRAAGTNATCGAITTMVTKTPTDGPFHVLPFGSSIFAIVNMPPQSGPNGPAIPIIVDATNARSPVCSPAREQGDS